jgi:hypothetical protein
LLQYSRIELARRLTDQVQLGVLRHVFATVDAVFGRKENAIIQGQ